MRKRRLFGLFFKFITCDGGQSAALVTPMDRVSQMRQRLSLSVPAVKAPGDLYGIIFIAKSAKDSARAARETMFINENR
jgi:hypothetical protein